ncbi:MAG: chemotaxis protein MotB [Desulfobacteraceae bacterium Eth-SRB1]|nr:MAG: chemotaxis protein MotB [Desulfobacteraceae bacterium Eth-SRB1]
MSDNKKKQELLHHEPFTDEDFGESENDAGWILTYSDTVTLLLCFFVLLFAMSSVKEDSFDQLMKSLKAAIGKQNIPEEGTREGLIMYNMPAKKKSDAVDELGGMVQKELKYIVSEVREFVMFNNLSGKVKVEGNEMGATITISDMVLFPSGGAKMTSGGLEIMKKLSKVLKQFSYHIKIEGHTDNVPIHNARYESNWELSANRACEIVRFLIKQGIDHKLLSAEGRSEYSPIAENDTPDGRASNRRVGIIYERRYIENKMKEFYFGPR